MYNEMCHCMSSRLGRSFAHDGIGALTCASAVWSIKPAADAHLHSVGLVLWQAHPVEELSTGQTDSVPSANAAIGATCESSPPRLQVGEE